MFLLVSGRHVGAHPVANFELNWVATFWMKFLAILSATFWHFSEQHSKLSVQAQAG